MHILALEGMLGSSRGCTVIVTTPLRMSERTLLALGPGEEGDVVEIQAGGGHDGLQKRRDGGDVRDGSSINQCQDCGVPGDEHVATEEEGQRMRGEEYRKRDTPGTSTP